MQVTMTTGFSQPRAVRPVSPQTKFGLTWQKVLTIAMQEHNKNIDTAAAEHLATQELSDSEKREILRRATKLAGHENISLENIQAALKEAAQHPA